MIAKSFHVEREPDLLTASLMSPGDGGLEVEVDVLNDPAFADDVALLDEADELPLPPLPFDGNLAETLTEDERKDLVGDLEELFESDLASRQEWEKIYTDGLDLLGIKIEDRTVPWAGACGVTHPMILQSAVRFQSKASVRLFPAKGPVLVKVIGSQDDETLASARRVQDDLNYYCTERMTEYFPDTEQLLFALPIAGSAFRKIYYDPDMARPCATFIPAMDFVMPAGFPNLESCPRYAQRIRTSIAGVKRLQELGYYLPEVEIEEDTDPTETAVEEKESSLSGVHPSASHNEIVTLIEMHTELSLPGYEEPSGALVPYVVTWEKSSGELLAVRRNWREDDPRRAKLLHFSHYRYVPGLDSYGYGLIHLIGGIAKSTTSLLRQLIDSGTLANLPGGLKARTLRIKGEDAPIAPGEWRDVDVPSGKISDGLFQLPYKEPSLVLLQLFDRLAQEGKEFASIADLDISAASANAPVGTIMALLERASEVITAVQARLHATFKGELNMIADCVRRYDSEAYDYPVAGVPQTAKQSDYARRWSIRPVSDPSSSTTAQRIMQYQAAMNFAQQSPQIYDVPKLHREMLANLGIDPPEELIPDKDAKPMDPVSENMAMVNQKPVKAFDYQDHESHISVHMSFSQDAELQGMLAQSPMAGAVNGAFASHIAEHVAFAYRKKIEQQLGVPLPPLGEELPPEVEKQISALEAPAAAKLAQQRAADAQQKKAQEQEADPLYQLEKQRVANEAKRIDINAQVEKGKLDLASQKLQQTGQEAQAKQQTEQAKVVTDTQIERQKLQQKASVDNEQLALEQEKLRAEVLDMRGKMELMLRRLDIEKDKVAQQGKQD